MQYVNVEYKIISPFGLELKDSSLMSKIKFYSNKYVHPVQIKKSGSAYESIENGFCFGLNLSYLTCSFFITF